MAPQTIPGMYKAAIEAAIPELVDRVWRRDHLPDEESFPYVTIFDGLGDAPRLHGDGYGIGWARMVQVDLWEDELSRSDLMYLQLVDCLDNLPMTASEAFSPMRTIVDSTARIPDEEPGISHTAITCRVMHTRKRPDQQEAEPPSPLRLVRTPQ